MHVVFVGAEVVRRLVQDGDADLLGPGPDMGLIHLFQRNLEREAQDEDDLAEQIRITVIHETAHYFGYTEGQLRSMGLA